MFQQSRTLPLIGLILFSIPALALAGAKTLKPKKHAGTTYKSVKVSTSKAAHRLHHHELAPVAMPAERASEIQAALIKQGYMTGTPTGTWDTQTVTAMQKMQGDNGWQTKITPDSRALIKLGLGPQAATESVAPEQASAQSHP